MIQTLKVTATIRKPVITESDKRRLCVALINQILGADYVQELSQQGQGKENPAIEAQFSVLTHA